MPGQSDTVEAVVTVGLRGDALWSLREGLKERRGRTVRSSMRTGDLGPRNCGSMSRHSAGKHFFDEAPLTPTMLG